MTPWQKESDPTSAEASELLEQGADLPAWSAEEKSTLWRRIQTSAASPASHRFPLRYVLVAAASGVAIASVIVQVRTPAPTPQPGVQTAQAPVVVPAPEDTAVPNPAPAAVAASEWKEIDLGAVGQLRARTVTTYELPTDTAKEYRVELRSGELCAVVAHRDLPKQGPFVVETSHAQVVVVGTQFCVEEEKDASTISVTEGRVKVQTPRAFVFLSKGQRIRTTDPRLNPPVPAGPAPTLAAPQRTERPAELAATPAPAAPNSAAPSQLAEQNALYAKALRARDAHDGKGALSIWNEYLTRYPKGLLAPEASAGVLTELMAEGRSEDALSEAHRYLSTYPEDGRAAEVSFIQGNLIRNKLGCTPDALTAYQTALRLAARASLRDDSLFAVAACHQKLGHKDEAKQLFDRYKNEFPSGAHASEVARWSP